MVVKDTLGDDVFMAIYSSKQIPNVQKALSAKASVVKERLKKEKNGKNILANKINNFFRTKAEDL